MDVCILGSLLWQHRLLISLPAWEQSIHLFTDDWYKFKSQHFLQLSWQQSRPSSFMLIINDHDLSWVLTTPVHKSRLSPSFFWFFILSLPFFKKYFGKTSNVWFQLAFMQWEQPSASLDPTWIIRMFVLLERNNWINLTCLLSLYCLAVEIKCLIIYHEN